MSEISSGNAPVTFSGHNTGFVDSRRIRNPVFRISGNSAIPDVLDVRKIVHTVDRRNSATVDRFPGFSDFRFFLIFWIFLLGLGAWRVSNRQEIAWRFIWTNSQPGKWHMSLFSIIFIFSESFPRSPDSVLTSYLLHFDEVGQMSLVSVYSVEPKRCATQNDADS